MKICKQCGIKYEGDVNFCTNCGSGLVEYADQKNEKKNSLKIWIFILSAVFIVVILGALLIWLKSKNKSNDEPKEDVSFDLEINDNNEEIEDEVVEAVLLTLSEDERYQINSFLSNFSEQWFCENSVWDSEHNSFLWELEAFEQNDDHIMDMVNFACIYAKLHLNELEYITYEENPYFGIKLETVASLVQSFFGYSISENDIETGERTSYGAYETILIDGYVCQPAADGETYSNISIVKNAHQLKNDIVQVEFDIYTVHDETIVPLTGTVQDDSVYRMTLDEVEHNPSFEYHLSGTAKMKSYKTTEGEDSYQLIFYEVSEDVSQTLFGSLPEEFVFSSGVGAWRTTVQIGVDGSFTGLYQDSDMGDTGAGYSGGTVYISNFFGEFYKPVKIDDYTYSMKLKVLETELTDGTEYYENDIRYIVSEPAGFENAEDFYIYLPGAPVTELPEDFLIWVYHHAEIDTVLPAGCYGLYNEGGRAGFLGYTKDSFSENSKEEVDFTSKEQVEVNPQGPKYYADVYESLTLRDRASTSASAIAYLPPCTEMYVLEKTNGMAKVQVISTGQIGYVNLDYITSNPNDYIRVGRDPEEETGSFPDAMYYTDVNEYLTLRDKPSTSGNEITRLPDDTLVYLLKEENHAFSKVQVAETGEVGYVMTKYLKKYN